MKGKAMTDYTAGMMTGMIVAYAILILYKMIKAMASIQPTKEEMICHE